MRNNANCDEQHVRSLDPATAKAFCDQFSRARELAFQDSEAFDEIIYVVERLGCFLCRNTLDLFSYGDTISKLAENSALAKDIPAHWPGVHIPFARLYQIVKDARNDAMHQGAVARHITTHAVELALILEDALTMNRNGLCSEYMVRNPVCAELWQPISFIRQQMLTNSFSYLPIKNGSNWFLISDVEIAKYLQAVSNNERKERLARALKEATEIELRPVIPKPAETPIREILPDLDRQPILLKNDHSGDNLVGIITAFDLL